MTFTMKNCKGEEMNFEFNGKESFLQMVGTMYDAVEADVKKDLNLKTEDEFWKEILERTGIETKEDFWHWINIMGEYDMIESNINMQERIEGFILDELSHTGYNTISEMLDKIEELEGIISDIHEQTGGI